MHTVTGNRQVDIKWNIINCLAAGVLHRGVGLVLVILALSWLSICKSSQPMETRTGGRRNLTKKQGKLKYSYETRGPDH
jgi:hypothetical protein